jgi:hypothetical protein
MIVFLLPGYEHHILFQKSKNKKQKKERIHSTNNGLSLVFCSFDMVQIWILLANVATIIDITNII